MNSNENKETLETGVDVHAVETNEHSEAIGTDHNGDDVQQPVLTEKRTPSPLRTTAAGQKPGTNGKSARRSNPAYSKKSPPAKKDHEETDSNGIDLSPYVSNPEGNIYAVRNIPEEFIATLFAWVSRSPKSFKAHLQQVIQDFDLQAPTNLSGDLQLAQKASDFHAKWTVAYGHSSVAEHAKSAVGIEKVSRLVSAELELSNQFLSITEYSQRYQKPESGDWFNPYEEGSDNYKSFESVAFRIFELFESLIRGIFDELRERYMETDSYRDILAARAALDPEKNKAHKVKHDELEKKVTRKLAALKKLAFEDARYVLPLAMYTQLGVSANARSWADVIRKLGASQLEESNETAQQLREEISKVLPTLLRYATPSTYQASYEGIRNQLFDNAHDIKHRAHIGASPLRLPSLNESSIILEILSMELMAATGLVREQAREIINRNTAAQNREKIEALLKGMASYDTPPESFKHVNVEVSVEVSEANWHQLLRHNRMTDFTYGIATPHLGYKIPPRISEIGGEVLEQFTQAIQLSEQLYQKVKSDLGSVDAQYAVSNAHYRPVTMTFSLWEAYHLINLRTSEEAQWDIQETFETIFKRLSAHYPTLLAQAKRR